MNRNDIEQAFRGLQQSIISALEQTDGGTARFQFDEWIRPEGGGGLTSILQHGRILEKGGVNFSSVSGPLNQAAARSLGVEPGDFLATGVSIVLHPNHPLVPIIHMNVRYFEMDNGTWWFGGGIDLTPHYVAEEDARFFHTALKQVCDKHHPHFYPEFKAWADDYFYIKHREETRGIGGIFFDRLNTESRKLSKESLFDFVLDVGNTFAPTYCSLMQKNFGLPYSDQHKNWQLLRRGRYVEFNLVYDRGTRFGLETGGRIESILMSLPELASWKYNVQPDPASDEGKTLGYLKKGISWV